MLEASTAHDKPGTSRQAWMFRGPAAYGKIAPWRYFSIVGSVVILIVLALVSVNVSMAFYPQVHTLADDAMVKMTLIGMPFQQLIMIGLAIWAVHAHGARIVDAMALRAPVQGWRAYAISIAVFVLAIVVLQVVVTLVHPDSHADIDMFKKLFASPGWWIAFLIVSVGAPLSEELLFRGYLFRAVAQTRIGVAGAALVTSGLFALVHSYSVIGMVQVFVIGMLLAWALIRTGSLRVTMLIHGIHNGIQAMILMAGGG